MALISDSDKGEKTKLNIWCKHNADQPLDGRPRIDACIFWEKLCIYDVVLPRSVCVKINDNLGNKRI